MQEAGQVAGSATAIDVTDARERLSWARFGEASRDLAQLVADDGYRPDMILAVARGGLLVAGALGYALGVKNVYTMNVEFYTGVNQRLDVPMLLPPVPDLAAVAGAKVLVADDVADTGKTIKLIEDFCAGRVGELRTAVLYEKPRSEVHCEYVWCSTDKWIDFPWSDRPPVTPKQV